MDELAQIVKEKQPTTTQELVQFCLKASQDAHNAVGRENVQSMQNFNLKYKIWDQFKLVCGHITIPIFSFMFFI